ncbi:MAG: T9SS type A sorting domain-containing protein [Ignavibacterium sp.]|nr:T9SS type A sorting domain-containing protein [Ignavibacterium sp.]
MKKIGLTILLLFLLSITNFGQVINFDTTDKWLAGSGGGLTSYQVDHQYTDTINGFPVSFMGGPALRQTTTAQDGFPGALGTYGWRLQNTDTVEWIVTIGATSINGFSFQVRRWDGSPSPDFDVAFSSDAGNNWTSVGTINNAFLDDSSDWKAFNYPNSITSASNIQIRISANGTTERIMVDDFFFDNPLPVELSSFSASVIGSSIKLNWRTETEQNNYGFEVERKVGSPQSKVGNYEKIGFIEGYGNSNSPKSYSFNDNSISSGILSYRLKQIDNDGSFSYSKTIDLDLGAPKKFELTQNFPNPFNPNTAIRFSLPETGNVKLTVFNLLGQEVAVLVNGLTEAGTHIINFDAEGLNSGVYIYRIESGRFNEVRKMTLIK